MTYEQLKARFPHAIESFLRRNSHNYSRLPSGQSQSTQGRPLVGDCQGKEKGDASALRSTPRIGRARITYRIFARRPADWDNYSIKEIQDCLITAGLLVGDQWSFLEGRVISQKVSTPQEERTEILIEPIA